MAFQQWVNSVFEKIKVPKNISLKERRYYFIGLLTTLFPLIFHIGTLIFFGVVGVNTLFFINFFSVALYIYSFYLVYVHGRYFIAIILGAIEVWIFQVICIFAIGWDSGFQYYFISYILAIGLLPPKNKFIITFFEIVFAMTYFVFSLMVKNLTPFYSLDPNILVWLHTVNVLIFLMLITLGIVYFIRTSWKAEEKAEFEFQRAEKLLLNILPSSIADRLKAQQEVIADDFESATVLFADIVDFTKITSDLPAYQVVSLLNDVFTQFDELAEKYQLEKIKTIGDSYMVVSGVPYPCQDHAKRMIEFSREVLSSMKKLSEAHSVALQIRIGVCSGPVVAGVIGKKKFIYDLWGDTVNLASRLEANGIPGKIQVGESTYQLLKDQFPFEDRGFIEVKGKGRVKAYLL
jgi:adenylate cyclase